MKLSKSLGLLTAAVLWASLALPASAASKSISLTVTPVPAPLSPQTTTISAVITNTGNSNANSFEIDWSTSPYFTVTGASANGTPGSCSTSGSRGAGYSSCVFLKQIPTKTSVTITLNVQVTNECNALSINWYAYAWTGSPGAVSQSFLLDSTPPPTTSSPNCSLTFGTQPTAAFIGSTITGSPYNSNGAPVTVRLQRYGSPVAGATVTLSASPTTCATGSASVTTNASGTALVAFKGAAAGSCVLNAASTGFGSVASQSFQITQQQGDLGCDENNKTIPPVSGTNNLVYSGSRLPNVDDVNPAPACVPVPYVVSTTCPAGSTATACTDFRYDPLDQGSNIALTFHWDWPLQTVVDGQTPTLQFFLNGTPVGLDLTYCPEIKTVYVGDEFVGIDPAFPPLDQETTVPGTQAGCLIHEDSTQISGQLKLIQDAYVQGDFTATRK